MDSVVERALLSTGAIEGCVVRTRSTGQGSRVVAYVVPRASVPFSVTDLRRRVAQGVSASEAPDVYVELRRIPLTPDG
jgi:acyl-coenzyme A synthetase/AMP-(fatty) acid ligase